MYFCRRLWCRWYDKLWFFIFHCCNHCIKESVPFSYVWFCSLNSIHALKIKWTIILIERKIGGKIFQTSLFNTMVDWHRLFHKWWHLYSGMHSLHPKSCKWVHAYPQYQYWLWSSDPVTLEFSTDQNKYL